MELPRSHGKTRLNRVFDTKRRAISRCWHIGLPIPAGLC